MERSVENESKERYMKAAYAEAEKAFAEDEVPVGCVIVKAGKIIARAHNRKEKKNSAIFHAEIECINKATRKLNNWNLKGCELYVTLEPCMMCTSAIVQSHIKKVIYCLKSPKYGYLLKVAKSNKIECIQMYNQEYEKLLKNFFADKR